MLDTSGRLVKWAVELSKYDISYLLRTTIRTKALANFIFDMTGTPLQEALEKDAWLLHVDGSDTTQGNGTDIVITSPQGEDMESTIKFESKAFNNKAEYEVTRNGHDDVSRGSI
ncbi:UNVERIFIED_CONTAM: hypothetical protein Slati_1474800 [Sesamum latifolium]|uniref:Uncharacterized protein n=1 Tax=Sesamum latifolium TaxID=2727402 RepID=A0AAW2X5Q5_9LAMI